MSNPTLSFNNNIPGMISDPSDSVYIDMSSENENIPLIENLNPNIVTINLPQNVQRVTSIAEYVSANSLTKVLAYPVTSFYDLTKRMVPDFISLKVEKVENIVSKYKDTMLSAADAFVRCGEVVSLNRTVPLAERTREDQIRDELARQYFEDNLASYVNPIEKLISDQIVCLKTFIKTTITVTIPGIKDIIVSYFELLPSGKFITTKVIPIIGKKIRQSSCWQFIVQDIFRPILRKFVMRIMKAYWSVMLDIHRDNRRYNRIEINETVLRYWYLEPLERALNLDFNERFHTDIPIVSFDFSTFTTAA